MTSLAERCFDATLRVEKIVHLPTMTPDLSFDLYEWLIEDAASVLEELGVTVPEDNGRSGRDLLDEEFAFKRTSGWLVAAATPVRRKVGKLTAFSWGDYYTKVFYGDTYEEALDKAFAWAEEQTP